MIVKREDFLIKGLEGNLPSSLGEKCVECEESIYDTAEVVVWVPLIVLHPLCAKRFAEKLLADVAAGGRYLGSPK